MAEAGPGGTVLGVSSPGGQQVGCRGGVGGTAFNSDDFLGFMCFVVIESLNVYFRCCISGVAFETAVNILRIKMERRDS